MYKLETKRISKNFGGVIAVDEIDFQLEKGEIHSIIGENGAGKSTFVRMIAGDYKPDGGELFYDGNLVRTFTPKTMEDLGIRIIYQEFNLVNTLTVAENIFIGKPVKGKKGKFVSWKEMNKQADAMLKKMGFDINPTTTADRLSTAEQQVVEILKALSKRAEILIMDEPTAALNEEERNKLFGFIRQLASEGVTIIYISHHLEEVIDLSDRISVFRDGKRVTTVRRGDADIARLVSLMVGREINQMYPKTDTVIKDVILEAIDLNSPRLHNISFTLRRGEMVGVYGLLGAGQLKLCSAFFGDHKLTSGNIMIKSSPISIRNPIDGKRACVGFVPLDRKSEALFMNLDVGTNLTMCGTPQRARGGLINFKREHEVVKKHIRDLNIKTTGYTQMVKNLSGGNQQKVVIARWIDAGSEVLVLCDPTRGVDVGAKVEIYKLLGDMCAQGKAVLIMSSDLPELMGITDRILVMRDGRIAAELRTQDIDQIEILRIVNGDVENEQR